MDTEIDQEEIEEAIEEAIEEDNLEEVERLLSQGFVPNYDTLNFALEYNSNDDNLIINRIIEKMVKEGRPSDKALNYAILSKDIAIIKMIYKDGGKPDEYSLNNAIETKNINIIKYAIEIGCKPNESSLIRAINTKDINIFKLLISLPNIQLNEYILHRAIELNLYNFVEYIISLGSKPTFSSLDIALKKNYIDIAKIIANNIIIADNNSYNTLLFFLSENNIDKDFFKKQINPKFFIKPDNLTNIVSSQRADIFDVILEYYPIIDIQKYFDYSIQYGIPKMVEYFFSKGAVITDNSQKNLFGNNDWFRKYKVKDLEDILFLFFKNGLIINDELITSLEKKYSHHFQEYEEILYEYKKNINENCYLKNSEDLKVELKKIGIKSINNIPLDKIESTDELCDLLENEYKIFILAGDGLYPEGIIYDSKIEPTKVQSSNDEVNKCFTDSTAIGQQNYKNIPQDRYIIFMNRCYYIFDIIIQFMYGYGITDIKSFLISDKFNITNLGKLFDPLIRKEYNNSFKENGNDHYIEFFNEVNNFVMYLKKLMNIDYTKLNKDSDKHEAE